MTLHMFSYGYHLFPSPHEIKQGIQLSLCDQLKNLDTKNERHAAGYKFIFEKITDKIKELEDLPDPFKPLTSK